MKYKIYHINGKKLLDNVITKKSLFSFDFEFNHFNNYIVDRIELYNENALFYQIKKHYDADNWDNESLLKVIICIDFDKLFNFKNYEETYASKIRALFDGQNGREKGFSIKFEDDEKVRFVPYDKSSSMSRKSRIMFIREDIKEEIDKRILLSLPFEKVKGNLSKYYAYRGLYLSDSKRIDLTLKKDGNTLTMPLNERTVIVVNDITGTPIDTKVISAVKNDNDIFEIVDGKAESVKFFDGEGLISPHFSNYLNAYLKTKQRATSFQIRMPFTKGMLHEVDFNKFVNDVNNNETIEIFDAFGIKRNLHSASIILTESMFKCSEWLKEIQEIDEFKKEYHKKYKDDNEIDVMKYYFAKMEEFDHSLYVQMSDINLSNSGYVSLNYQFISTLDMNENELNNILESHKRRIEKVKDEIINDEEIDCSIFDDDVYKDIPVWKKALQLNNNFVNDKMIKTFIDNKKESLKNDIAVGKLLVSGESKYLSDDLLRLLIHIYEQKVNYSENDDSNILKEVKKRILHDDRFYVANPKKELEAKYYYALLRNPHLSRNEEVMAKPYLTSQDRDDFRIDDEYIYDRYFSHLNGIIMVSSKSLIPATLGGADFDGDIVKLIYDYNVIKPIKRGVYKKLDDKNNYKRELEVIKIPSLNDKEEYLNNNINYSIICNTFSNNIGKISNLAVKFLETKDEEMIKNNVECTIIVGLDIDAAKTGIRPIKNIEKLIEIYDKNKKERRNYFLNMKEFINKPRLSKFKVTKQENECILKTGNENKNIIIPDENSTNLTRLPYLFVETLETIKESDDKTEGYLYKFEEDNNWKKTIDETLKNETKELMNAYKGINSLKAITGKLVEKNRNYTSRVYEILKNSYSSMQYVLLETNETIEVALNKTYQFFINYFDNYNIDLSNYINDNDSISAIEEAMDKLDSFIFQLKDILEVLKESDDLANSTYYLFFNPLYDNDDNFNPKELLRLILLDIQSNTRDFYINKTKEEDKSDKNNKYYKELSKIYYASLNRNEDKKILTYSINDKCYEMLMKIFKNKEELLVKTVYSIKNINDRFIWEVVPEDLILSEVYIEGDH